MMTGLPLTCTDFRRGVLYVKVCDNKPWICSKYSVPRIVSTNLLKNAGITSENGRNDAKRLNINVVTVSNDDKPKKRKTQRKVDLRRRTVCKSLPVKE